MDRRVEEMTRGQSGKRRPRERIRESDKERNIGREERRGRRGTSDIGLTKYKKITAIPFNYRILLNLTLL